MTIDNFDDNEARLDAALALLQGNYDDVAAKKLVKMYSESRDGRDPNWLNYMGIAYEKPGTSIFDESKAHNFFLRAANLGSGAAAYNLGVRWLYGHYDQIDTERARHWFQRAFELGHGCGGASYSTMLMGDPRYGDPQHAAFTEHVHDILRASEKQGGPWAFFETATLNASGRLAGGDFDDALQRYLLLASEEICAPPRGRAALCLALHAFLGHRMPIDMEIALKYLDRIPAPSEQESVLYGVSNTADRLRHIITKELMPYSDEQRQNGKNSFTLRPDHQTAYDVMNQLWWGGTTKANVLDRIKSGHLAPTQGLKDRLWAQVELNRQERSIYSDYWEDIRKAVHLRSFGASEQQLASSTRDFGPQYNEFSSNGFPIPGALLTSGLQDGAHPVNNVKDGFGKLAGLRATHDGNIAFRFETLAPGQMPLLFPEDIDVALVLAFSGEKAQWPSVSIEDFEPKVPDRPRWPFNRKDWNPYWIGKTLIGKTLYGTDYWIGALAWQSNEFPVGKANGDQAKSLLQKFALCGGRRDGLSSRVMIRPTDVHWDWSVDDDQAITFQIHSVKMRVDGGNIVVHPDGTEDRSRNLNSPNYATGRVANLLTEHYDEIADLWPMFERLRQINGILYSLAAIRDLGFKPSGIMKNHIAATRMGYTATNSPDLSLYNNYILI